MTAAGTVKLSDFPKATGQSISAIALKATSRVNFAPANATFAPGMNRVAFGLIGQDQLPLNAPTVVYVATSPKAPAQGPYAAPADPIVPQAAFLSKGAAADTAQLKAIYEAQVPFAKTGKWYILTMSKSGSGYAGSTGTAAVTTNSPIPSVGQRAPVIHTPTVASAGGDSATIDTRKPPAPSLQQQDFAQVVGHKPVGLLFATPALCQSRVCGPVTDMLLQLQAHYGNKIAAIHQEVYRNNKPPDLTAQMTAYSLQTEPWFFAVDRNGIIRARLEGAFGLNAMNSAIEAALQK